MLNSVLFGPVDQLVGNRDTYVATLEKSKAEISSLLARGGVSRQIYVADTDAQALADTKEAELWYQESLRRFVIPERIAEAHPSLQPGFRAMADRLSKVTWEALVAETLAFGSPDTVARHIAYMRDLGGPDPVLDELRRPRPGQDPPLDGALRPRSHATFSLMGTSTGPQAPRRSAAPRQSRGAPRDTDDRSCPR